MDSFSLPSLVESIADFRIEMVHSDPLICRELEIPVNISLYDLSVIIQASLEWKWTRGWEFIVEGQRYGNPILNDDYFSPPNLEDAQLVKLESILDAHKVRIDYLYDYKDCWDHLLTVSHVRMGQPDKLYPRLIAAECAAPSERSGGVHAFNKWVREMGYKEGQGYLNPKNWIVNKGVTYQNFKDIHKRLRTLALLRRELLMEGPEAVELQGKKDFFALNDIDKIIATPSQRKPNHLPLNWVI